MTLGAERKPAADIAVMKVMPATIQAGWSRGARGRIGCVMNAW